MTVQAIQQVLAMKLQRGSYNQSAKYEEGKRIIEKNAETAEDYELLIKWLADWLSV